jgi:hypothetical protein
MTLVLDVLEKNWRYKLYLAYAGAWASLGAYLPTFLIQADAGVPRTWIPSPTLGDLGWFYSGELAFTWAMPAGFLLLHLALSRNRSDSPSPIAVTFDRKSIISCPLLIASASFILLPIFIWLISHLVKPIFVGRYMIPTLVGMACATAHYASYLLRPQIREASCDPRNAAAGSSPRLSPLILSRAAPLLLLGSVAFPVLYALDREDPYVGDLSAYGSDYPDLPTVVQYGNNFLQQVQYNDDTSVVYVLDWESAVDPDSGNWPPQEYKHLEALLRQFPDRFDARIVESGDFLSENPKFLVWDALEYNVACG